MAKRPEPLTAEQRERLRAVWQTMLGYRPGIRHARSTQRGFASHIILILSNPAGALGYGGRQSDRRWATDATKAAALLVVEGALGQSDPPLTYEVKTRMVGIIRRYILDGQMTKKELLGMARVPNSRGLMVFFAPMCDG